MVLRIVRFNDQNNWGTTGQFYSVRPDHSGMRVIQLTNLFPPEEAFGTWEASEKTDEDWQTFKSTSRNHLIEQRGELIRLIREMNERQDNYALTFLVGEGEYERSYEWCVEQWLVKGFGYQGQKYRLSHSVEYLLDVPSNLITHLEPHQIFVFGSNTEGRHGKGAAKAAMGFGAIYGQAKGLQGQTYAIITKDLSQGGRSISLDTIESQIIELIEFATQNPNLEFLVSKFGCSLAGYTTDEVGQLWGGKDVPTNIVLPSEFLKFVTTNQKETSLCQAEQIQSHPIEVPVVNLSDRFVTLHNHTTMSDGLGKVKDLVQAAVDFGHPAVAITDHGSMMGCLEFYELCKKFNIKPILGNEMYLEHPYTSILSGKPLAEGLQGDYKPGSRFHQIVLAKSLEGYRNLSRLTTWSELENKKSSGKGKAYPLITFEKLKEHSEGLIVTSGCIGSLVPQLIIFGELDLARQMMAEYQEVFGEDYYVELQDHDNQPIYRGLNRQLLTFAKELGVKWVISPDTHFMKECHYETHRVFSCIKGDYNKTLKEAQEAKFQYDKDLFFPTSAQLGERFEYLSVEDVEAGIATTLEIAEKVSTYDLFRPPASPEFPLPPGIEAVDYLRNLSLKGLSARFDNQDIPQKYLDRLEYELEVIHEMGFDTYFLIVHDYIDWARSQGIPTGMGRGSAAGSLVAYALRITGVDPIHYGLLFERFLNPERKSMPDIDSDFCQERRGEVIDYVTRKYGRDKVAQIGTINTLTSKAVVKEVARVLQIPLDDADKVSKSIPVTRGKPAKLSVMISEESPVPDFRDRYKADLQFKTWIDFAMTIEGSMKSYGTHAAGVVIADIPLSDLCPLMTTDDGTVLTQYTMDWIERLGWLKMDFLGLKTLTVLNKAARDAEDNKGITIDLERIPKDDPAVYEIFKKVDVEGVFQFESPLFQQLSQQLQPDNMEDLGTISTIARPGSLDTGVTWKVVECKKDPSQIKYDHPDLEPLLNMTYGWAIYQEQILKIVQDIGGFSLGEADLVRRACGKKKLDVMKGYEDKFMAGCVERGYPQSLGETLWEYIQASAEYIFNKSHSIAYGYTSYDCAWFKTYHRPEFMAALISYEAKREKVSRYLNSSKRQGINILPPDVNLSGISFTPKNNQILFGLKHVKGIGEAVVGSIIEAREEKPFENIADFYSRTGVDVGGLASLVYCGAFDSLHPNRKQLIDSIKPLKKWFDNRKEAIKDLPRLEQELEAAAAAGDAKVIKAKEKSIALRHNKINQEHQLKEATEDFSLEEKLFQERESIGFFVSGNPVESLPQKELFPLMVESEPDEEGNLADREVDYKKWITVSCSIVDKEHKIAKKNGNPYCNLLLEDHAGTAIKCIVFKNQLEKEGVLDTIDNKLAFIGKFKVEAEKDGFKLMLQEIL